MSEAEAERAQERAAYRALLGDFGALTAAGEADMAALLERLLARLDELQQA